MTKIVSIMNPVDMYIKLYVFKDDVQEEVVVTNNESVVESILGLIDTYSVKQLDMVGPKNYSNHFGNEVLMRNVAKYGENSLIINYI